MITFTRWMSPLKAMSHVFNRIRLQAVVMAALLLTCGMASAQISIVITEGRDNPVSIAIVPFAWEGFGALPEDVSAIVSADLRNSGEFAPIDPANMLSTPHEQSEVYFRDWRFLGAQYLLIGTITNPGNAYSVQYELFDVAREVRVTGEVLGGTQTQLRDIAHRISDVVFELVTGVRGAFGTKILYVAVDRRSVTESYYELVMSDADGGRPQVLLSSQEPIMSPTWSPDATKIAYVSFESTRPRIYMQDLQTGTREMLTDFPGLNSAPAFSPDGTRMAMVLSRDGDPEIYVMDLRTRQLTRVASHYAIDTEPSWTPDGRSIIFTSERGGSGRPQIYQVELATGLVDRLTFDGTYNSAATMLEDGQNLILVHRADTYDDYHIALMNLNRGTIRDLTETQLDESPSIAPNASMVIYASKAGERGVLNAVSIDGRLKFQLPSAAGEVREPSWSPFLR